MKGNLLKPDTEKAGRPVGQQGRPATKSLECNNITTILGGLSRINLKNIIGAALLFGNKQNPAFWTAFEVLLLLWIDN